MRKNQLLQKLPLLASFFFLFPFCFAQVTEQWVARYNSPDNNVDVARALAVDVSGNVYVTGVGHRTGGVHPDYATIKYNKEGVEQWVTIYNGPADLTDVGRSIAVDPSGNVYVTGPSAGTTGTGRNFDYATIKYNAEGVEQWVARYSGPAKGDDNAEALAVDALGNVYVIGRSMGLGTGFDYATIKYNAAGVQQWVARYNGPANGTDAAFSLALDAFGNVYVTGASVGMRTSLDYATIKYNTAGVQLWVARYNGPAGLWDEAYSLFLDAKGNVYVTGASNGIGRDIDYATIKYNAAGVQLWVARYNGPGNGGDAARSLAVDGLGNVYVTGYSDAIRGGPSDINMDYATIKYNDAGVEQWVARHNGSANGSDYAFSLALDASENVYVTGSSKEVDPNWDDYTTIKYNATGTIQWLAEYNGPAHMSGDYPKSVAVDASGNVYVTGESEGIGTRFDYVTIKYSQLLLPPPPDPIPIPLRSSLPSNLNKKAASGFRVSNFPNPVSTTTRIQYEIPFDGRVAIKVYDISGREVKTLVNAADKKAGYHNIDFDVSSFQSGVYYYKAILDGEKKVVTQSGKIIVVK